MIKPKPKAKGKAPMKPMKGMKPMMGPVVGPKLPPFMMGKKGGLKK